LVAIEWKKIKLLGRGEINKMTSLCNQMIVFSTKNQRKAGSTSPSFLQDFK
jgi:hypothetical protein